jgi:hypothetical protein
LEADEMTAIQEGIQDLGGVQEFRMIRWWMKCAESSICDARDHLVAAVQTGLY